MEKLIASPKSYLGKLVVIRAIPCVDPGGTGFLCEAAARGRKLRINATVLGPMTALPIAKRLIKACKGILALSGPRCRVDVVLRTTSADMSDEDVVTIFATEIEMYVPTKIR